MSAQGAGESIERYATTAQALVQWWELTGDEQGNGKTEEEKGKDDGGSGYKGWPGSARKPRRSLFPCQRDTKDGHDAPRTPKKVAGGVARAVNTVQQIYQIAIQFETQITPKFLQQLKNLQKQKLFKIKSSTTLLL